MSLRQKSIRGMAWSFTETIGVKIFSVSVYFLLAKILGPEPFGLVALTSSFIFLSSAIVDQGFVEALIQRKELNDKILSSAFWGIMGMGASFFVLLYFSAPFIADAYSEPQITGLLQVHALNFIISSSGSVHRATLERNFNFRIIAIGRIVGIVLGGITSIVMAFYGYGAWCLVIQHMIFSTTQTAFFWIHSKWTPTLTFSWTVYKTLLSFGSKIVVTRILSNFNQYLYNLIIGYYFNASVLGYFSLGLKVFNTTNDLIITSANKVLLPMFSGLQDDKKRLRDAFYKCTYYMLFASLPLFSALIIIIPDIIEMFYGSEWLLSKVVIQILALAGISVLIISIAQGLMIGTGNPEKNIVIDSLNLIVGIGSLFLLFDFGVAGAAWSFVIKYAVTMCLVVWLVNRQLGITKSFIISLVKPILLFGATTILIMAAKEYLFVDFWYELLFSSLLLVVVSLTIMSLSIPQFLTLRQRVFS